MKFLCNLLTENNQHVVLTEEQKGHKLCSFVLASKVICLHVSLVSARNFYLSTLHGNIGPDQINLQVFLLILKNLYARLNFVFWGGVMVL